MYFCSMYLKMHPFYRLCAPRRGESILPCRWLATIVTNAEKFEKFRDFTTYPNTWIIRWSRYWGQRRLLPPSQSQSPATWTDMWRPSIMLCIQQGSDGEITRDLVTQMFYVSSNSTVVAKKLVRKYPFMKDVGNKVSGFVSFKLIMHNYTEHYKYCPPVHCNCAFDFSACVK